MKEQWREYKYIFNKKQRKSMIGLIAMLAIGALLETAATAMMLPFMNTVIRPDTLGQSEYRIIFYQLFGCETDVQFLIALALCIVGIYVLKGAYNLFSYNRLYAFVAKNQAFVSGRLFECYMSKPYSYYLHKNSAEVVRTVTADTKDLFVLVQNVLQALSEVMVVVFMLVMLLSVDPKLTLIAVALIAGSFIVINGFVTKRIKKAGARVRHSGVQMIRWVNQSIGGLKGIKANMRERFFINSYASHAERNARETKKYNTLANIPRITVETVSIAGIFACMAVMAGTGYDLNEMLPLFATFAMAAVRLMPSANRISTYYNAISFYHPALNAIYKALVESRVDMEANSGVGVPSSPIARTAPLEQGVKVSGLTFRFEDSDEALFENVSFDIPAGKSTAFVGTTGSGKTTMADVILGVQRPASGKVLADGHDIHAERQWWADRVGYIPQFIYIGDDTVRANVAFGYEESEIDDEWVWKCLEDAQMKEFVTGLPQGLDTIVGEGGVRLSGGQRQRIGIARALYTDPQMLVMDEATSALDNETEQAIIESINRLSGEKTLLIIAHRLTTIEDCDIIYRVENGKVVRER